MGLTPIARIHTMRGQGGVVAMARTNLYRALPPMFVMERRGALALARAVRS